MNPENVIVDSSSKKNLYPNQKKTVIPEKILFKSNWSNRHTRRGQFGGMAAPRNACGARKDTNKTKALEDAALAYIRDKVTCKIWDIPVRPESSSKHRRFIRRLIAKSLIVKDPFSPGYIHAVQK